MGRMTVLGLLGLVTLAGTGLGCDSQLKKNYADLQASNRQLTEQNNTLQAALDASRQGEADARNQLSMMNGELSDANSKAAQAQQELAKLKASESQTPKPPAGGWVAFHGGARITLSNDLLFAPGKAALSAAGKAKLEQVARALKSQYAKDQVLVLGYTDSTPIRRTKKLWQDNLDLSANRAMSVTRELIHLGVSASRIETTAMGDTHPIASNGTAAGRTKNRRVEVVVLTQ